MKFNYLLFVFYLFISSYQFVSGAECGPSAPPLSDIIAAPYTKYWYRDIIYGEKIYPLVEYGAYGNTTGSIADTYINNNNAYILRLYAWDIYNFYFTYNVSGVLCNRTATSENRDLGINRIAKLQYEQPKCIGSKVMITIVGYPSQNLDVTYVQISSTTSYSFSSNPFEIIASYPGFYTATLGPFPYVMVPFKLEPINTSLQPQILIDPYVSGGNQTFKILNYQSFDNITVEINSISIPPQSPGVYQYDDNFAYDMILILNSQTCGEQTFRFSDYYVARPDIVSTILQPNDQCSSNSVDLSFDLVPGVVDPLTDIKWFINNSPYTPGTRFSAEIQQTVIVSLKYTSMIQFDYMFAFPTPMLNISYEIITKPTCSQNGLARILYDGSDFSMITVNDNSLNGDQFELVFNQEYIIQHKCNKNKIRFTTGPGAPLSQFAISEANCFGIISAIVQNYDQYDSVILYDSNNFINYTTTNGVFTPVQASNQFNFYYESCGSTFISHVDNLGLEIDNDPPVDIRFSYDKTIRCSEETDVQIDVYYKDKLVHSTLNRTQLGVDWEIQIGTCNTISTLIPNLLETTTVKIIKKPVCKESEAIIQFVSEDDINYSIISLNGNEYSITKDLTYHVQPGNYSVDIVISGNIECHTMFNFSIPYEKDVKLGYIVQNQDSNRCDSPNANVTIDNYNDYSSLILKSNPAQNGVFNNIENGLYIVLFTHNVCGVGQMEVEVKTDGYVTLQEIQPNTCPSDGNGVYQPNVVTTNGTIYTSFSVQSNYYYDRNRNMLMAVRPGHIYFIINKDYCMWSYTGNITTNVPDFNLYDLEQPDFVISQFGNMKLNYSGDVILNDVNFLNTGSQFKISGNELFGFSSTNLDENVAIFYDGNCRALLNTNIKPIPYAQEILSLVSRQCGSADAFIKFGQAFLDKYKVTSLSSAVPDTDGYLRVYLDDKIVVTRKSDGYFAVIQLPSYIDNKFSNLVEPQMQTKNESCMNNGDGSMTILNYDPTNYSYSVTLNGEKPKLSNGSTWYGLESGDYELITTNQINHTCSLRSYFTIGSANPIQVSTSTVSQCLSSANGTVTFESKIAGVSIDNILYAINGVTYSTHSISLPVGHYNYSAVVLQTKCKQIVGGWFEIQSNILNTNVTSPKCSTARIQVSGNEDSQLSTLNIKLFNITSGNNIVVGLPTTGPFAEFSDLKNGTYQFVVTDPTSCQVKSETITIIECDKPINPTETPVNQSNILSPSFILLFIFIIFNFN